MINGKCQGCDDYCPVDEHTNLCEDCIDELVAEGIFF